MAGCIHVVAGVLRDSLGRVLIAQRLSGTHLGGRWEFPGGKLLPAEQRRAGLIRELKEELGITVTECSPLMRLRHRYPERGVLLDFWSVQRYEGQPIGAEGQALKWLHIGELHDADLLEADKPVIAALSLPDRYAITPQPPAVPADRSHDWAPVLEPFLDRIVAAATGGASLIQLRAHGIDSARLHALAVAVVQAARGAAILLNGDPKITVPIALASGAAGVHLPSRFLPQLSARLIPPGLRVGVSCHDLDELRLAAVRGADFAVLGPVLPTATHPGTAGLGWDRFAEMVDLSNLPVYALGGVGPDSIKRARSLGAQGVAGIRAFFPPRV